MWHNRLGHPHARVLGRVLKSCSVNKSIVDRSLGLCTTCQLSKSARFPLLRVGRSSSRVLDLIYTDI